MSSMFRGSGARSHLVEPEGYEAEKLRALTDGGLSDEEQLLFAQWLRILETVETRRGLVLARQLMHLAYVRTLDARRVEFAAQRDFEAASILARAMDRSTGRDDGSFQGEDD